MTNVLVFKDRFSSYSRIDFRVFKDRFSSIQGQIKNTKFLKKWRLAPFKFVINTLLYYRSASKHDIDIVSGV